MLPVPGDVVDGKYRVVRLIGEGGMGSVFEATHEVLGTPVALKFLDPELGKNPLLVARFLQEARVSATVRSPHVVQVFDVSPGEQGAHLVMEMLAGESLGDRLERGALDRDQAIEIALQMLSGLEVAHGLGVVHRDLKPDNVFITAPPGSVVKLLDFGIAKLKHSADFGDVVTRPGSMMGTPAYMAPEQAIAAERVDQRADLYSVGVIMYEMLTGALPVDSDEPSVIIEKVMKRQTVPILERDPSLPRELADLVTHALAPNPADRPESAAELRLSLTALARTLSPSVAFVGAASSLVPTPVSVLDAPRGNVPATQPPDEPGPPRSVVGAPEPRQGTGTAPPGPSPTASPSAPPPAFGAERLSAGVPLTLSDRRRGSTSTRVALWLLVLLAAAAVALGVVILVDQGDTAQSPPPLPEPPSVAATPTELERPNPLPRTRPSPRPAPRSGAAPRPAPGPVPTPSGAPAGVPLPTIQLPSALPLPPGLPPLLPPGFPGAQSPGVAPASSTGPPPAASAP